MIRQALALLMTTAVAGCFTVQHRYDGPKLLTPDPDVPGVKVAVVKHFKVHRRQFFWIHGGIPVGEPLNGAALAAREIGDHDGVVNLKLGDGQDVIDALIHIPCLLGIVCGSWSAWAEGDVVDFEEVQ